MKGGQSFLYGGNLPKEDWLHAVLAFVHVRNRLPTTKLKDSTPYEIYNKLNDNHNDMKEQIKRFRRIGCLCYVTFPLNVLKQRGKNAKRAYRAMLLGYAEHDGQKGYKVRDLKTGKVHAVAYNQVYKFYEDKLVFPKPIDHDAWLRRKVHNNSDNDSDSDSDSDSDNYNYNHYNNYENNTDDEKHDNNNDSDSDTSMSRVNDVIIISDNEDQEKMARLEMGLPLCEPPERPQTRHDGGRTQSADSTLVRCHSLAQPGKHRYVRVAK